MEPLYVLFAATGFIFWAFLIVTSIAIIASLEYDSPGWATTWLIIAFLSLCYFTDFTPRYIHYFTWQNVLTFVLMYIVAGMLWSFLKWYLALSARRERWLEAVADYQEKRGGAVSLNNNDFRDFIYRFYPEFYVGGSGNTFKIRPRPRINKKQIIGWMTYWPWSLLWSLFDDIIKGFFRWLYRQLTNIYEGIAHWVFKGVEYDV